MSDIQGPKRDVSPVGQSRFERPFERSNRSHHTSPTTSATTTPLSGSIQFFGGEKSKPPADSIFSNETMETSPTSVSSNDRSHSFKDDIHSPVCVVNPDDWFARFRSDSDLGATDTDEYPDRATLAAVQDIPIFDPHGKARPFGSLYEPEGNSHLRQLIVFVRHFYCGACQAYLKALTESISPEEYFSIAIPTQIIIIGCGQPDLIPQYRKFSGNCPFPIFADPTRQLFKKLGMTVSLNIGRDRPEYMKDISAASWAAGQFKTVNESLKDPEGIRKRDVIRGGNPLQIGGEFLFEEGQVLWCHRMKNYRNHAEIKVVRKLLELDE